MEHRPRDSKEGYSGRERERLENNTYGIRFPHEAFPSSTYHTLGGKNETGVRVLDFR